MFHLLLSGCLNEQWRTKNEMPCRALPCVMRLILWLWCLVYVYIVLWNKSTAPFMKLSKVKWKFDDIISAPYTLTLNWRLNMVLSMRFALFFEMRACVCVGETEQEWDRIKCETRPKYHSEAITFHRFLFQASFTCKNNTNFFNNKNSFHQTQNHLNDWRFKVKLIKVQRRCKKV